MFLKKWILSLVSPKAAKTYDDNDKLFSRNKLYGVYFGNSEEIDLNSLRPSDAYMRQ